MVLSTQDHMNCKWWSCQNVDGPYFLAKRTAARVFTALQMHSCWQQGVVILDEITFAQIVHNGPSRVVEGIKKLHAFSAFKFHFEEIPKNKNLWASAIVCRTWIWRSGSAFEIACVSFFLPLHLWVWRFAQCPPLRLQARKLYQGRVPVKKKQDPMDIGHCPNSNLTSCPALKQAQKCPKSYWQS